MRNRYMSRLFVCLTAIILTAQAVAAPALAYSKPDASAKPKRGEPFSQKTDIVTRDLLYDKATNKQFIAVQDRDGNVFYLVIDYDAPVNEEEEQYSTYFLNPVDLNDLASLAEKSEETPPACICTEKCVPGKVNMGCPVCAANISECVGREPEPPAAEEPPKEVPEAEPVRKGINPIALLLPLIGALAAGVYFFKKVKARKASATMSNPDDYDEIMQNNEDWVSEGTDEDDLEATREDMDT